MACTSYAWLQHVVSTHQSLTSCWTAQHTLSGMLRCVSNSMQASHGSRISHPADMGGAAMHAGKLFDINTDRIPGASVYVIDGWGHSAAVIQGMRAAGLLPLCYIRWVAGCDVCPHTLHDLIRPNCTWAMPAASASHSGTSSLGMDKPALFQSTC